MSDIEIDEIRRLIEGTTPGNWSVSGLVVKNRLMSATGDWPAQDDEANHAFLAKSKDIVIKLLAELDKYRAYNDHLNSLVGLLEMTLERQKGCSGPV